MSKYIYIGVKYINIYIGVKYYFTPARLIEEYKIKVLKVRCIKITINNDKIQLVNNKQAS